MMLPRNLLIGDELVQLRISRIANGFCAEYAHQGVVVAEYAGYRLAAEAMSEDAARKKLSDICQKVGLLTENIYAR